MVKQKSLMTHSQFQNIITNLQIENKVMAAAVNMNIVKKTNGTTLFQKK